MQFELCCYYRFHAFDCIRYSTAYQGVKIGERIGGCILNHPSPKEGTRHSSPALKDGASWRGFGEIICTFRWISANMPLLWTPEDCTFKRPSTICNKRLRLLHGHRSEEKKR
jgi:hypothetical protein